MPQQKVLAASSVCEARQKLSEEIFQELNKRILFYWKNFNVTPLWKGHNVFAVDGSKINLPRKLIKNSYKIVDKKRRYYPEALVSSLYLPPKSRPKNVIL